MTEFKPTDPLSGPKGLIAEIETGSDDRFAKYKGLVWLLRDWLSHVLSR